MILGGLYSRLGGLAAGAVAVVLVVAHWFCRPLWQRPPGPQGHAENPEQQALLNADDAAANEEASHRQESGASAPGGKTAAYRAPEVAHDAPLAPEDVVIEPANAPTSAAASIPPVDKPSTTSNSRVRGDAAAPDTAGPSTSSAPAAPAPPAADSNPVNEDYLRSLLDQQFGPPKFAVRKEAPPAPKPAEVGPGGDLLSLEELLDQQFGPPKFTVQKPASPTHAAVKASGGGGDVAAALVAAVARVSGGGGVAAAASAGVKRAPEEEAEMETGAGGGGLMVLTFNVTHGPVAGKSFVADDPSTEYKIGRLPDCSFQILDQEISGRHASLRWDGAAGQWKLHDVGSLNGTSVNGVAIGRDYKVPGDEQALAAGDLVEWGSVTRASVALTAATEAAQRAGGGGGGQASAKRHHGAEDATAGAPTDRSPAGDAAAAAAAAGSLALGSVWGLGGGLPAPTAMEDFPQLGARLCVHNRLGTDHKRLGQGCEDVPHWELPYEPYGGAGLLCVFDGHHGSKAAFQAKEHVAAILRSKLLLRDGRTPPPLPPPPPPRQRKAEEEDEEGLEGGMEEGDEEADMEEGEEVDEGGEEGGTSAAASSSAAATAGAKARKGSKAKGGKAKPEPEPPAPPPPLAAAAVAPAADLLPPPPAGPPLPPLLRGRDPASQKALLKDTFLAADQHMSMEEGCTATVVMLEADRDKGWALQSANVGDSSAVLVNFSRGTWSKLSEDHRIASSVSERQRLAQRGHTVRTRLYGLNISRMLGDRFLKEEDLGFLAEPFVSGTAEVGPTDVAVLVVASDGLWDVLPEDRAGKLLLQEAAKPNPSPRLGSGGGAAATSPAAAATPAGALGCHAVADFLLAQALVLRSKDDVTIAVLELGPHLRSAKQE